MNDSLNLGVNIDHVATLRQARGTPYPDTVEAAELAIEAGAGGITVHLREDRRHIQDEDITRLLDMLTVPMNFEMAVTEEMLGIAESLKPAHVCFVPEKREELTTEGGLDVKGQLERITAAVKRLSDAGLQVSLFIDADPEQIDAAIASGAPVIELHTGAYADHEGEEREAELHRIAEGARRAHEGGLTVHAGHGLTVDNVGPIAALPQVSELNIGHAIIARAVMVGLPAAVREMRKAMDAARGSAG